MSHFLHNLRRSFQRREVAMWLFGLRIVVTLGLIAWMLWTGRPTWMVAAGALAGLALIGWMRRKSIQIVQIEFWASIWLPLVTGGWTSPWMIDTILMIATIRVTSTPRDRWFVAGAVLLVSPILIAQSPLGMPFALAILLTLITPWIILGLPTPAVNPRVPPPDAMTIEQLKVLQDRFEQLDRRITLDDDAQTQRLVRDGARVVHALLNRLAPDEAPLPSVITRMQALIEHWQSLNTPTVEFVPLVFPKALPPVVESIMLRGLEETLANISRHAQASHVNIDLGGDDELLLLTVSDNGRGLQQGTTHLPGCHGLRALRYRLQEINGQLDVFEAVDGGVVVQLALPITIYAL